MTIFGLSFAISLQAKWTGEDLITAAKKNEVKAAQEILNAGINPDYRDAKGKTPLMHTPEKNAKDVADLLIQKEANINAQDDLGRTPLMWAAIWGSKDVADSLINTKGLLLDTQDIDGNTALIWAVERSSNQIASALIKAGAALAMENNNHLNAYDIAKIHGNTQIMNMLPARPVVVVPAP